jgi:hypothetical protein
MQRYILHLTLLLAIGSACISEAQVSAISYSGGDGSSFEKAIIIKGATEATGVKAEYEYLSKHFPGYKMERQSLLQKQGRTYDLIEFATKDGKKAIFFDITDFFGKF